MFGIFVWDLNQLPNHLSPNHQSDKKKKQQRMALLPPLPPPPPPRPAEFFRRRRVTSSRRFRSCYSALSPSARRPQAAAGGPRRGWARIGESMSRGVSSLASGPLAGIFLFWGGSPSFGFKGKAEGILGHVEGFWVGWFVSAWFLDGFWMVSGWVLGFFWGLFFCLLGWTEGRGEPSGLFFTQQLL